MLSSFEDHVYSRSSAVSGRTVAVTIVLAPLATVIFLLFILMPVTAVYTVMLQYAVFPPSAVVQIMVVVPAVRPVTTPYALTVATAGFEDSHLTFLFCASDGTMFALSV